MPVYETEKDRKNEKRVIDKFLERITTPGVKRAEKSEQFGRHDYKIFIDERVVCIVEVKGRNGNGHYRTWSLSKKKMDACIGLAWSFQVPLYICFSWGYTDDGDYCWKVKDADKLKVEEGGRWDRNNPRDVEMMVHIPREYFATL